MNSLKPELHLEPYKDKIISSIIEYIQEYPRQIRDLNGKVEIIDDSDIIKKSKKEAVNIIRDASNYQLLYKHSLYSTPICHLKLGFNNSHYKKYLHIFNRWKGFSSIKECEIYTRINRAFKDAIEFYITESTTIVVGVFIERYPPRRKSRLSCSWYCNVHYKFYR